MQQSQPNGRAGGKHLPRESKKHLVPPLGATQSANQRKRYLTPKRQGILYNCTFFFFRANFSMSSHSPRIPDLSKGASEKSWNISVSAALSYVTKSKNTAKQKFCIFVAFEALVFRGREFVKEIVMRIKELHIVKILQLRLAVQSTHRIGCRRILSCLAYVSRKQVPCTQDKGFQVSLHESHISNGWYHLVRNEQILPVGILQQFAGTW